MTLAGEQWLSLTHGFLMVDLVIKWCNIWGQGLLSDSTINGSQSAASPMAEELNSWYGVGEELPGLSLSLEESEIPSTVNALKIVLEKSQPPRPPGPRHERAAGFFRGHSRNRPEPTVSAPLTQSQRPSPPQRPWGTQRGLPDLSESLRSDFYQGDLCQSTQDLMDT